MEYIQSLKQTAIKRVPKQSSGLGDTEKMTIPEGRRIPVEKWEDAPQNFHYRVLIHSPNVADIPAGWWYLFDSNDKPRWDHWELSWDNEALEEDEQPLNVVSQVPNGNILGSKTKPHSPFTARLSRHITYGEFCLYKEERRFYEQYQVETAVEICEFLEKCRLHFGGNSLVITSGHRPPRINAKAGGSKRSEHLFNAPSVGAVDFRINNVSTFDVQDWCDERWPYSIGYGAKRGFIHLGLRRGRPRVRWPY